VNQSPTVPDADEGLPEAVADAWVTVLLDLWEKDQAAKEQATTQPEKGEPSCPTT
jgi:hypothetical protein